ncbi:CDP-diacylglycerol--serine O-phosphatidyltransferase [Candidatus Erwinia haradaeae]|uniref:CDP-diacylglycerol--serine O-phosphatidyltransferase n=1 Tax=Candidatus Erwinia haradaeae TaxID=1922217 RepID=A0A451DD72_9GAMM|nr:CDP-diacylglycerol--serine O-phosphatidyltransferase [Candidatus Erwinia haradaeae]VFP84380.1 CDP-diacylglycerol--serine O-phosphatidyltransferase [Candidatus Erwinia haradaeae]
MLSTCKNNSHHKYLAQLPKIAQSVIGFNTLFSPAEFCHTLLEKISSATHRIYIVALYLDNDEGGQAIFSALYAAKKKTPHLEICILVDWHRAQRCRFGAKAGITNADWYYEMSNQNLHGAIPVYGIPVNTREALGVLHLKGSIIDNTVLYTGASFNNVYLHHKDTYRYDRYQLIRNKVLADTMLHWIKTGLLQAPAVHRLDRLKRPQYSDIKYITRKFRKELRRCYYKVSSSGTNDNLSVTPLLGLGKHSILNKTIHHLMLSSQCMLMICTPYFNLPKILVRNIVCLLRQGKIVEIIVGDKTANDFYIPEDQPFTMIGTLPYLYEMHLRCFLSRFQHYINNGQLIVRLWADRKNSYHLKGIWVDDEWMMLTGNNLNPRAWCLDLENAVIVHDPMRQLLEQRTNELKTIRQHTTCIQCFQDLESVSDYPDPARKLICLLRRMRIDRLLRRIL